MVIVGLLIVAVVCLALGLILPSTAWLIASLIASVGAGYVLFRARTLIAGVHAVEGGGAGKGGASAGRATAVLDREPHDPAEPATKPETTPETKPEAEPEAEPRRTRAQSRAEARAAKASARTAAADLAERDGVDELDAHDVAQVAEVHDAHDAPTELLPPVAADDAVEVSGGELLGGLGGDASPAEPAREPTEANEGDVWVIDGRPRYHLSTCAIIQGQDAEPIPFEQATEDGFMPCSLCEPNVLRVNA